jgi:hypothetical protein
MVVSPRMEHGKCLANKELVWLVPFSKYHARETSIYVRIGFFLGASKEKRSSRLFPNRSLCSLQSYPPPTGLATTNSTSTGWKTEDAIPS